MVSTYAHAERTSEALLDLVENTVKFSPVAGGTIRIGAGEERES
jgi:signal transduction histidine kinase